MILRSTTISNERCKLRRLQLQSVICMNYCYNQCFVRTTVTVTISTLYKLLLQLQSDLFTNYCYSYNQHFVQTIVTGLHRGSGVCNNYNDDTPELDVHRHEYLHKVQIDKAHQK